MKIQSPWMGRVRGSAGNMTGCKIYDKNVMRAKAFEVSNPNTAAQKTQRTFFAELTALCSDFDEALLRTLFPQKPKSMSRRNAITKQIAANNTMSGSDKVIDFAKIDTLGNASVMDMGTSTVTIEAGEIQIDLDASLSSNPMYASNYMFAAFVNETKKEIYIPAQFTTISDAALAVYVPSGWQTTDTVHAFPFITNAKSQPSGFGTISVTKRPAHKES